MSDKMQFPNTFEEFLNEHSFRDSDEVYTNGSELIQVFRVMQGYEHFSKQIREEERAKTIEEMARRLNLKFVELPLDDLIVADILKEIGRVAKQMKGDKE